MKYIELKNEDLDEISGLWEELNLLHCELSSDFRKHFESFSFSERVEQLLRKEHLTVFLAKNDGNSIGYCVVTKDHEIGELDSIYVKPEFRGQGIGRILMSKSLEWVTNMNCESIKVDVVDGNCSALRFYEKYGFKKRLTVLQKV